MRKQLVLLAAILTVVTSAQAKDNTENRFNWWRFGQRSGNGCFLPKFLDPGCWKKIEANAKPKPAEIAPRILSCSEVFNTPSVKSVVELLNINPGLKNTKGTLSVLLRGQKHEIKYKIEEEQQDSEVPSRELSYIAEECLEDAVTEDDVVVQISADSGDSGDSGPKKCAIRGYLTGSNQPQNSCTYRFGVN